jgi:hypothetical protein
LRKPPLVQMTSTSESRAPSSGERYSHLMSEFELMSCPADSIAEFIQKHTVRLRQRGSPATLGLRRRTTSCVGPRVTKGYQSTSHQSCPSDAPRELNHECQQWIP